MEPGIKYTERPSRSKINSLKTLCEIVPPRGQEGYWVVYSYVLNDDICKKYGEPDNLYGLLIFMGCYANRELATKKAEYLTQTTGNKMGIVRLCRWSELKRVPDADHTVMIHTDTKGKLIKFEDQEFRRQQEHYQKQYEKEQSLLEEQNAETDSTSIAYYKQQWLLTIRNYARIQKLKRDLSQAEEAYSKRVELIRNHHSAFPDHDRDWLHHLQSTGYTDAQIEVVENAYKTLKSEILNYRSDHEVPEPTKFSSNRISYCVRKDEKTKEKCAGEWHKVCGTKRRHQKHHGK